jgi:hypothetical protein
VNVKLLGQARGDAIADVDLLLDALTLFSELEPFSAGARAQAKRWLASLMSRLKRSMISVLSRAIFVKVLIKMDNLWFCMG